MAALLVVYRLSIRARFVAAQQGAAFRVRLPAANIVHFFSGFLSAFRAITKSYEREYCILIFDLHAVPLRGANPSAHAGLEARNLPSCGISPGASNECCPAQCRSGDSVAEPDLNTGTRGSRR